MVDIVTGRHVHLLRAVTVLQREDDLRVYTNVQILNTLSLRLLMNGMKTEVNKVTSTLKRKQSR